MFVSIKQGFKGTDSSAMQETNSAVGKVAPTAANIRMGGVFKPNGIDVRKPRCAGVEVSMDPSELFDKKFIGLQNGGGRQRDFFKNLP